MQQQKRPSLAFAIGRSNTTHFIESTVDGSPKFRSAATAPNTPHSYVATPHSLAALTPACSPPACSPTAATPFAQQPVRPDNVSVIAPGGGTGINGAVYAEVGMDPRFRLEIVGQSRAPYDCYPETWPNGGPAPNLVSFAQDVLNQGVLEKTDCLVCGSRGGQVVLPHFWQMRGAAVPPAVVLNGGVAMGLPTRVMWPDSAVTFLLIGGQDNFRGSLSPEEYVADTKARVPKTNGTTAILYVEEMQHMPQASLLRAVLPHLIRAVLLWKPHSFEDFLIEVRHILRAMTGAGWHGRLLFTQAPGVWEDIDFSAYQVGKHPAMSPSKTPTLLEERASIVEHTKRDEMKALLWAAVRANQPGGGQPLAGPGKRFVAAAAAAKAATIREAAQPSPVHSGVLLVPPQPTAVRQKSMGSPGGRGGRTPHSRALGLVY